MRTIPAGAIVVLSLAATVAVAAPTGWLRIGVAGGVRGAVKAVAPGVVVGRDLRSGQALYLGETISTGPDASVQVMLNDETVFTIGPNSAMTLDRFAYDENTLDGTVAATIKKGVFRFVTGLIGHRNPSNMRVRFPNAVAAVRGTVVAGEVADSGVTTVVLLGPGPSMNAPKERVGAFSLQNAGKSVDVTKPGYASRVDGFDGKPTAPTLLPAEQLNRILGALSSAQADRATAPKTESPAQGAATPEEPAADGMEASAKDAGGQPEPEAGATENLSNTADINELGADMSNAAATAANDIGNPDLASLISFYQSSWDDVRTITNGTGYYDGSDVFSLTRCNGGACAAPTGSVSMHLDIDFGAKTVGSGASQVTINASDPTLAAPINETIPFAARSYAGLGGPATLSGTSSSGAATASVSLLNLGGTAQSAIAETSYSNGAGTVGSGAVGAPLTCTSGNCK